MPQAYSPFKTCLLFFCLIMGWGLSWPISKVGLLYISPLWFSAARLVVGCIVMLTILVLIRRFKLPKKDDWPLLMSIGFFQISGFLLLVNFGLMNVHAGRAAIITYTTPLWVTPISVLFFKEKLVFLKVAGLILGMMGILILFNPWSLDWSNKQVLYGNGLLLLASLFWSIAIIHSRFGVWHSPAISLFFWQLLFATFIVLLFCFIFEPKPIVQWCPELIFSILYLGVIATAFGFWGAIELSRRLSPITISLTFLLVPVVGLIISALFLNELIAWHLILAMLVILLGITLVILGNRKIKNQAL